MAFEPIEVYRGVLVEELWQILKVRPSHPVLSLDLRELAKQRINRDLQSTPLRELWSLKLLLLRIGGGAWGCIGTDRPVGVDHDEQAAARVRNVGNVFAHFSYLASISI